MRQAVMTAPGVIAFREVEAGEPGSDEVLLSIQRIGICGSDIHVYHGLHPYTSYPVVQGHEVSARVEIVGADVRDFGPGDRVTVMPQKVCGVCLACRTGRYHICDRLKVMGFQTTGMASDRFVVAAANCVRFSPALDWDAGAMIEPLAVAVHAVGRLGDVTGLDLVVYGAGPIGNLVAQTAKGLGARRVLVTDTSDFRLNLARDCGADFTVNPLAQDVGEALTAAFGPDRSDAALECVGIQPTMDQAVTLARKGSDIVVVGVFGRKPEVDLGLVQDRELRLIGTLMYQKEDFLKAIDLVESGKVNLKPLMSRHFTFGGFPAAYEFIESHKEQTMKVFIDVGNES